jgi:hypothetical protein
VNSLWTGCDLGWELAVNWLWEAGDREGHSPPRRDSSDIGRSRVWPSVNRRVLARAAPLL